MYTGNYQMFVESWWVMGFTEGRWNGEVGNRHPKKERRKKKSHYGCFFFFPLWLPLGQRSGRADQSPWEENSDATQMEWVLTHNPAGTPRDLLDLRTSLWVRWHHLTGLTSWGCHDKVPQSRWLKMTEIYFFTIWRLEVQIKMLERLASAEASLFDLEMAALLLDPRMVLPLCVCESLASFSLLIRTPVVLDQGPILTASF